MFDNMYQRIRIEESRELFAFMQFEIFHLILLSYVWYLLYYMITMLIAVIAVISFQMYLIFKKKFYMVRYSKDM